MTYDEKSTLRYQLAANRKTNDGITVSHTVSLQPIEEYSLDEVIKAIGDMRGKVLK